MMEALTIEQMIEIDPEIGVVFWRAAASALAAETEAQRWNEYLHHRRRLTLLVGWDATDDQLATAQCYDDAMIALAQTAGVDE